MYVVVSIYHKFFLLVVDAAVSEWEESTPKEKIEENIYSDVKTEPTDGEETFEVGVI